MRFFLCFFLRVYWDCDQNDPEQNWSD